MKRKGNFESAGFTIAATPEAFRILSDGLYSDKVRAVIRELSTNANDSHIEKGNKDVPFDVHLPSYAEPWFSVRDYGTGMSHEKIIGNKRKGIDGLYTTYFGTDKLDNTRSTGQLGLGSKSPLSYTRSFNVTSYYKGKKRIYIVSVNEEGKPDINFLADQVSDCGDETGVEVQIAVSSIDFGEFECKAKSVYEFFVRPPRITNKPAFILPVREALLQGVGWKMIKRMESGSGGAQAIMGNIAYPIDASKIKDLTKEERVLLERNLHIKFINKQLDITPSREHLAYTKKTCAAIKHRLAKIQTNIDQSVIDRFASCENLWEARKFAYEMFWSKDAELSALKKLTCVENLEYNGEPIGMKSLVTAQIEMETGCKIYKFAPKEQSDYYGHRRRSNGKTTITKQHSEFIQPKGKVVFALSDIPRGSYSRCKEMVETGQADVVYLIDSLSAPLEGVLDTIGIRDEDVIRTSTLPRPQRYHSGRGHAGVRSKVFTFYNAGSSKNYNYWKETSVEMDNGGVYIVMQHSYATLFGRKIQPSEIASILRYIENCTGKKIEIHGIRKTEVNKFKKHDEWCTLDEFITTTINIGFIQSGEYEKFLKLSTYRNMKDRKLWASLAQHYEFDHVFGGQDHPFDSLMKRIKQLDKEHSADYNRLSAWSTVCTSSGLSVPSANSDDMNLAQDSKAILDKAPMFKMVFDTKNDRWNSDSFNKRETFHVSNYIHQTIPVTQEEGSKDA